MHTHQSSPLDVLAAYCQAVKTKDVEAFVSLYAEELGVFDAWDRWSSDASGWRAMAEGWFTSLGTERVDVEFEQVRCEEADGLAAVWALVSYLAYSEQGQLLHSVRNRYSAVLKREGTRWRILHEHTSVPVDFERGSAIGWKDSQAGSS